jgi:hypothetical protein
MLRKLRFLEMPIYNIRSIKMTNEQKLQKLEHKRQKCIVYTRVMGYHRPVESFNIGKTGEHRQRKQFIQH